MKQIAEQKESGVEPAPKAEEAAEILVDGEKTKDIFLLASSWYGVSYQNEDSLNKLMMMKYSLVRLKTTESPTKQ